jgi:5-methylcytosine-specific restriction enzyme B
MARFSDQDVTAIYRIADNWRKSCLIGGKSLLWKDEDVWSAQNLKDFKKHFTDNPDESERGFEVKFKEQLEPAGLGVTKLACEILLVYFLFTSSVGGARKRELIKLVASWKNIDIEDDAVISHLDIGIGGTGLAYNARRPFEIAYIGDAALELASLPEEERKSILSDDVKFRKLLDKAEGESVRQSRDILLNLLFPDKYERIASQTHKRLIAEAFSEILDPKKAPEDLDDRIYAIRTELSKLLNKEELDFYWPPLVECWYVSGENDELSPLQGLSIKRQIVLYGPPGTGKTVEAQHLADRLNLQNYRRCLSF